MNGSVCKMFRKELRRHDQRTLPPDINKRMKECWHGMTQRERASDEANLVVMERAMKASHYRRKARAG